MLLVVALLAAVLLVFAAGWIMTGSVRRSTLLCVEWFGIMAVLIIPAALIGWLLTLL